MFKFFHFWAARNAAFILALAALAPSSYAAKKDNSAGKEAVERHLLGKYVVSAFSAGRGPSPGGVTVLLMKPGLEATPATTITPAFSYKDGRIRKLLATNALRDLAPIPYQSMLYITKIEAREGHILFDLVTTQPYDGVWFKSALHIDFSKGFLDSPDLRAIDATINEVLAIQHGNGDGQQQQQNPPMNAPMVPNPKPQQQQQQIPQRQNIPVSEPPPPPAPPAEPPPPPEPPRVVTPAAPIELKMGMNADQVRAAKGQPVSSTKFGVKEILVYKDVRVTLTGGKVTNVE